jgi:RNA polymerase sigma factor (TIGR02999 family)
VSSEITGLIERWVAGDAEALNQVMPFVYERLRELAHQRLRHLPAGASLNTTELVHEAYVKLARAGQVNVRDRSHFLALASRVMRNLLVDQVRARRAVKRGGGQTPGELASALPISDDKLDVVTALDAALQRLEEWDPRQSRILEQRYFGGLSLEETAAALGVSLATVKRELRSARAWLSVQIRDDLML